MSDLYNKISNDIKDAMKAHDNVKRDCLRTVMSDIKNLTVNAGKELTDDACLKALQKSAKTHQDSIDQFKAAGRDDLASKEIQELDILKSYLPKTLSAEETESEVKKVLEGSSIDPVKKNMGQFMKILSQVPGIDKKAASSFLGKLLK